MLHQQTNPGEMEQAVKEAIDAGYRHFDTALFYMNEKEVGAAIRAKIAEGIIRREDVFVSTKVINFFLICIVGGGIKVHSTLRPLNGLLCQPRVIMIMEKSVE
jgi:hypothetical protein